MKPRHAFVLPLFALVFQCLIYRIYCVVFRKMIFSKAICSNFLGHISCWSIHSSWFGFREGFLLAGRWRLPCQGQFWKTSCFLMHIFSTNKDSISFQLIIYYSVVLLIYQLFFHLSKCSDMRVLSCRVYGSHPFITERKCS